MISKLILEDIAKGQKSNKIKQAIINRHPITFYYSSQNKNEVLRGTRIRSEMVALGLSKKGNVIVRGYVEPPSTSKKGFKETGWRTFRVDRMSNINILETETFDDKRPQYKEGEESASGPMAVTYVTTDWGSEDRETQPTPQEPTPQQPDKELPEPKQEPDLDDVETDLPEPNNHKPDEDPLKDDELDSTPINMGDLKLTDIGNQKYMLQNDYNDLVRFVYKDKEKQWRSGQRETEKNIKPGQGTRRKFEVETNMDVSDFIRKNNIKIVNELPDNREEINETIRRFKTLILY